MEKVLFVEVGSIAAMVLPEQILVSLYFVETSVT
jgi:hypothetical protein